METGRPPGDQPPPSTPAPIVLPPAQPEKPAPVTVPERRRSPTTQVPGGPPAPPPVPVPPAQKEAPSQPVVVQPPPETPRPPAETRGAEHLPDARYERVSWVVAEGDLKDELEVALEFRRDGVEIFPLDEETRGKTLSYGAIVSISYSQVEPSRWKKLLRLGSSHWLTVRTRNDSAVLHLDSRNYRTIIEAFEARTGLKVQR
jgi:hypothetical protein